MEVSDEQEDPEPDGSSDVSNEEQYEPGSEGEWAGFVSEVSDSSDGGHEINDAVEKATNEADEQSSGTLFWNFAGPVSYPLFEGSKYVPPHLRKQDAARKSNGSEEIDAKLVRQLKGLLNRCSSTPAHSYSSFD